VRVDPAGLRTAYLASLQEHLSRLRRECGRMKVDYVQLSTARPFDEALARYLSHRMTGA
jgi:hypothetical protein